MARTPVKFENPPVVEVVCGVLFRELQQFRTTHHGLYWRRVADTFPIVEEQPPIQPVIERFPGQEASFAISGAFPSPRIWMISADGHRLLQLQRDRFLFNWKREARELPYPSYEVVISEFERWFGDFNAFVSQEVKEQPTALQYELTYVNQIDSEAIGLVGLDGILVDHIGDKREGRFLPVPDGINWTSTFGLPGNVGRLRMHAITVTSESGRRVVRLDLTARGIPSETSDGGRKAWFDLAHEWITHGFADATSPKLQRDVWKRTQ